MNSSQRCGKTTHTTEVLQWMDTCFTSGRTAQDGKQGESPFTEEEQEYMELCLQMDGELPETLQIRIRGQTKVSDTVVCVCCRTPDQEKLDEAFR